ncbi:glycosyltransferase family 2 protein [Allobranchiibius sp. CTAmp26]|uniref:glycosyltransferase n=1 Tax=Allobranchiibius sp. CTAmp26 TaxID=2815214 RepID=UPI001AA1A278|nr:glycosyltransferase [Allobranchiibius sp. CTAmp26]MBO1754986.1 glycosyltransferase [Allobranchiibius sp. CTAmp26]
MSVIERVGVVVPARDEALLLPRCLTALGTAVEWLRVKRPHVEVSIMVVLDSCVDGSAAAVSGHPGVLVAATSVGNVGAARQSGVRRLIVAAAPDWFATTDADSAVPVDWLVHQVDAGTSGTHLLLGTVVPDDTEITPAQFARWQARHTDGDGHGYIHGANLGFSRGAYDATGGFRSLPAHEDVDFADRVKATGLRWEASAAIPVLTSARTIGRAPDGFAGYLRDDLDDRPVRGA